MNKPDRLCNPPAEQGPEKAGAFEFRNKIFNLLLPIFLAVAPAGCAVQKSAARTPSSPSAPEPSKDKSKKKPSDVNAKLETGNKKDGKGLAPEKSDKDKEKEEWIKEIKRLRYDREYYEKCYYNWECDQV